VQLNQKLTKRVRAQFGQPDRPSGAHSAATLDQAEARARPRARRQRSRDVTAQPDARTGPGPLTRSLGRAINSAVARFPWIWWLVRGSVRRFFDAVAVGWDERVRSSSPEYVAPLQAALDRLQARPARILDVGTGTGAAALELAGRYPDADVVGIDVAAEMVAQAGARTADLSSRVRFLVADIANFADEEGFDLIAMLNMPPFFDRMVALLRPGGFVVNASSYGARTPFFTPPGLLERGFERRGLRTIATAQVGLGTYYVATRG
jgi:SAM-dependent methyltransferase